MKKISLNKMVVLAMSIVIAFGCINIPTYAITDGWQNAVLIEDGDSITTDAITTASSEKWYKFEATEANSRFSIMLKDIPESRAYNCELRYQETAGARPIIVENTMSESSTGRLYIRDVLEDTGTYYIRVYSLTGETDTSPYTLNLTCTTDSITYGITKYTGYNKLDWAVCAEMVGKALYKQVFDSNTTSRTHQNAARFVQSSGSDDTAAAATVTRNDINGTATAANYIFAGDYMKNPAFVATEAFLTVPDFLKTIAISNKVEIQKPIIVQEVEFEGSDRANDWKYRLVVGADIANDMVCIYDMETEEDIWVDYTDWLPEI